MANLFFYETPPLDVFDGLVRLDKAMELFTDCGSVIKELTTIAMRAAVTSEVVSSSWEGDIRGGEMYFFALPDPENNCTRIGVVWKQDNNGTTFIHIPVELPWLAEYELKKGKA